MIKMEPTQVSRFSELIKPNSALLGFSPAKVVSSSDQPKPTTKLDPVLSPIITSKHKIAIQNLLPFFQQAQLFKTLNTKHQFDNQFLTTTLKTRWLWILCQLKEEEDEDRQTREGGILNSMWAHNNIKRRERERENHRGGSRPPYKRRRGIKISEPDELVYISQINLPKKKEPTFNEIL